MALRIEAVELRRVVLPLVRPFRTSAGATTQRDALLLRVITPDGDGWGECVAMAAPLYSCEYVDAAAHVLRHHLVPRLWEAPDVTAEHIGRALAPVRGHRMAKAAVEMAVLDCELKMACRSLAAYLGADRPLAEAGVSVGIATSIGELLDTVTGYLEQGYRRVKLKIAPGFDVEPVRRVRERFGDELMLAADANSAYTLGDADRLAALDPFGLVLVEQPLDADDLEGHAALAALIRTPICLDESITSTRTAVRAIEMGACTIVNIKAGRMGGYLEARRAHDACVARGVAVWCGGMLETGIGRAANLALAGLPGFSLPGDLSASDRYFSRDLTPPFVLEDGCLRVPTGPGIGVPVLEDALDDLTTTVEVLTAPR